MAIVGAGEMGVLLVNELLMNRNSRYHPIFFIDNDPRKIGTRIEGVPVIGPDHEVLEDIEKKAPHPGDHHRHAGNGHG